VPRGDITVVVRKMSEAAEALRRCLDCKQSIFLHDSLPASPWVEIFVHSPELRQVEHWDCVFETRSALT
jgi:hypothetical protein